MNKNGTISLSKLLDKELIIPSYQRPYEWNNSNVYILLDDIYINYKTKKNRDNKSINLGSIILNKNGDCKYEIVDGQQRLITLSLLLKAIKPDYYIRLLDEEILCISNTETRLINNYNSITEFLNRLVKYEGLIIKDFLNYIKNDIKFYVLNAKNSNEAFQLFDGRNSKYKDLTPVDLLKAYHLGAQKYSDDQKRKVLVEWNRNITNSFEIDNSCNKIEYLYNNILFNIYNWSLNKDIRPFTKKDIYLYKGFKEKDKYSYVKYYKNNNIFQINKPFKSGNDFFTMTSKFIKDFDIIIKNYNLKDKINFINYYGENFKYINYLYYGALFAFNDRFGNNVESFYKDAIEKFIYKYSMIIRVQRQLINLSIINRYVLTTKNNFFFECNNALRVDELLNLELEPLGNKPNSGEILGDMRGKLWKELQ